MKLVKILFLVIVLLVVGNVTLTNQAVDDSITVATLGREIAELQNQNTILKAEVASAGAIGKLTIKLEESGYVNPDKVVSLSQTSSIALNR